MTPAIAVSFALSVTHSTGQEKLESCLVKLTIDIFSFLDSDQKTANIMRLKNVAKYMIL